MWPAVITVREDAFSLPPDSVMPTILWLRSRPGMSISTSHIGGVLLPSAAGRACRCSPNRCRLFACYCPRRSEIR